jgi:hypothetical protein
MAMPTKETVWLQARQVMERLGMTHPRQLKRAVERGLIRRRKPAWGGWATYNGDDINKLAIELGR